MIAEQEVLNSMKDYILGYNAAIEEVIKEIEQWDKGCSPRSDIVPEIRKLKK